MITFGLGNLALFTMGLGIRMKWWTPQVIIELPEVKFENIPSGIMAEDITKKAEFAEEKIEYEAVEVKFKDR